MKRRGGKEWGLTDLKARLFLTVAFMMWLLRQNTFMHICGYIYLARKLCYFWESRVAESSEGMILCDRLLIDFKIVTASVNPDVKASMQNFVWLMLRYIPFFGSHIA